MTNPSSDVLTLDGLLIESQRELIAAQSATIERLSAELERVKGAVNVAAAVFDDYARQHSTKAAQSSDSYEQASRQHKAKRNADYAAEMRAALTLPQTNYERSQSVENGGK